MEAHVHPLDPLTEAELRDAVRILRAGADLGDRIRCIDVSLHEPDKADLARHARGGTLPRRAYIVVLDNADGATYEAIVSLSAEAVESLDPVPGVQPAITLDEYVEAERAVRADPRFQAALHRRGVKHPERVMAEAWTVGSHAPGEEQERRLAWTPCWYREDPADNGYSRPIEGLFAIVDLNSMEVLRVEEHADTAIPAASGDYTSDRVGPLRSDVRPLEISQPEGPSFVVAGREVRWQKWRFRVGFTPRGGPGAPHGQLPGRQPRAVGAPPRLVSPRWSFPMAIRARAGSARTPSTSASTAIGPMANSLELGCDCLGDDPLLRRPRERQPRRAGARCVNAICLHEEDFGILWKHYRLA